MDWTNKNVNPHKVVQIGDEVEVMVLDIDEERRRISLGSSSASRIRGPSSARTTRRATGSPGQIKSITDFGVFIGLPGGIDGLVHLSDLSWDVPGEEAVRNYKKGEELETTVLAIDPERERISLGVKQLDKDPLSLFLAEFPKGSIVKGTVQELDAKMATIAMANAGDRPAARIGDISRSRRRRAHGAASRPGSRGQIHRRGP